VIEGETFHVLPAAVEAFKGLDFAFFAGTEGAKGASKQFGWPAVEQGAIVIDNGDDFRMDSRVPLVIPEINAAALQKHQGLIANPNCSTIIALMALAPLHRVARIRRFIASTYQAVSGTGRPAMLELEEQVKCYAALKPLKHSAYPHPIAFNVIPRIGSLNPDIPGHTSEEIKMRNETRKILEDKKIRVGATCVRVPVMNGHCEALNIEFDRPMDPDEARTILAKAPGVKIMDNVENDLYPLPLEVSGQDDVHVGRIRLDESTKNGLALFVCGDNLRKGAATNAVQIAEKLLELKK
ncbi:MAG: aspartate-semialdehyde dehydrogenase, partial [Lentisphaerae bacterium]|nr:aspartate-semialdehyde dehydrogenase [Lentisphaerota bacterium]